MSNYRKFDFKKLYFILYIVLVLLVVYSLFKLGIFLFPFVIAIFFSIMIQPFSKFLEKYLRFSHKISTIISIIIFLILFLGIIVLSSLKLVEEIYNLSQNLQYHSNESKKLWNHSIDTIYSYLGYLPQGFTEEIKNTINKFISIGTARVGIFINTLIGFITSIPTVILYVCITILSTFFISLDKDKILHFLGQQFPESWLEKLYNIKKEMFTVLGSYVKAQIILMTICFIELLTTLNLLSYFKFNVKYPLIMSLFICIVDALPVLGAGAILLPWAVMSLFMGDFPLALALLFVYLLVLSVRQMLEPKLISQNIGVHPLITLISMYSGFKILGIIGFLVGPVVMIVLKNVFSKELEVGFFKEIFGDGIVHDDSSKEKKDKNTNTTENYDINKLNENSSTELNDNSENIKNQEDETVDIPEKYKKEFIETKRG